VFEVQLRSNSEGDLLHFKYYDASEDVVLDIIETYEFVINDILGDVIDPIFFNIGTGDEECVDDDAAVAPFDCAIAVANFGCDMAWGESTIGELCPVSCGACPEECVDDDAAVAPFDCAYAVASFGCDMAWGESTIGELCPESCGLCGGGDIEGCMDDSSCNYNPDATVDDGSCLYVEDCAGQCGGDAELDECGVCGGSGIPDGECDCDGNVDAGCGCGEASPSGCDNACGSTAVVDECGICDGDGSSCASSTIDILYETLDPVGGFQFNVDLMWMV